MKKYKNWAANSQRKKDKFYVVFKGRKTGIYCSWFDCQEQINKYSHAKHKSYITYEEAEKEYQRFLEMKPIPEPEKIGPKAKVVIWFPEDEGYKGPPIK
jgi:viroplasmin and RNaseH domain-containing protein